MSETSAALADGVLDPLARLLREMRAAGITDPGHVVRASLAAGKHAVKYPLFAWGAGVDPLAILWAADAQRVLVVADVVGDEAVTARAIEVALDVVALDRALAAMIAVSND
jgi:hypothetical protein